MLYGCPAEESGSGKAYMGRAGSFDCLDAAFSWHPQCENTIMSFSLLANYGVRFAFKGVSAHAAANPERGRSALDATELMAVGVNYLREHVSQEARMHYAYTDVGGNLPNVVQSSAELRVLLRAPQLDQVEDIFQRVIKIAQGAALMTETEMSIHWDGAAANIVVNDTLSRAMYTNFISLPKIEYSKEDMDFLKSFASTLTEGDRKGARASVERYFISSTPEEKDLIARQPIMTDIAPYHLVETAFPGSSDVGDCSWHTPTAQVSLACYPQGIANHSWQQVACGKSGPIHKGLIQAAKVMAMTALDVLESPQLLNSAQTELRQRLGGTQYHCPIPAEVKPV
jgi:aminobenzoyl-glutamate utilization protein B